MDAERATAPFKTGDHLRVYRVLYYYHGIYTGEPLVVQFGGSMF